MSLVSVTFQINHSPYNAGEVAGFPEGHAFDLVDKGIAIYTETKEEVPDISVTKPKKPKANSTPPKGDEPPAPNPDENNLGEDNENTPPKGDE